MKLENLTEIFNNKIFRIPDYQRGYSWENTQLEDLWRDVDILEENSSHYTGMLSIKFDDIKDTYFIIDGQQRITTLTILIKVITDRFNNNEWLNGKEVSDYIKNFLHKKTGNQGQITKMIFGYEEDNPSHIYFMASILGLENTDDSTPENTLYTKNLGDAKYFFEQKIKDLNKDKLEKLLKKITENIKFNFYQINDELNEFVAFETMNNRGKKLSTLELLKNRLIYLSTLLPKNDDEEKNKLRQDINNAWKTVYEYLGKNPQAIIKDDDFLRHHWIMNFTYDRAVSNVYKDFLLKEHFTREFILDKNAYLEISNYVANIQKSVKYYYYIHNPINSDFPNTVKKWLAKLNKLSGFEIFKPLLTVLFVKEVNTEVITRFLKYAERFVFVSFYLNHAQANFRNSHFYALAKKFNKGNTDIDVILNDENFDNISFNVQEFLIKISKIKNEFYGWKGIKYFLYEYELYLKEECQGELKLEWENINKDSIEHIYPQTTTNEYWDNFEDSSLLHDLGNLLLLSSSDNSKLGMKSFDIKKQLFSKNSFSAIEVSKVNRWDEEAIIKRRDILLSFMGSRWKININKIQFDDELEKLSKNRNDNNENIKIGELVRSNLQKIANFCENNPDELENLLDKHYSKRTFGINYAFFKKLDTKDDKIERYYGRNAGKCLIQGANFALTAEWFENNTQPFLNYLNKISP